MIEIIVFNGVTYTPAEFAIFAAANPGAFLPPAAPEPTLDERKAWKKAEITDAYAAALAPGIEAFPEDYPGKFFSIREESIGRFAVALQKAEAANQANLPLYAIDDELLPSVPLATAKAGFIACFDAAAALDARYRTLMKSIDTATNAEEVEALEW